MSTGITALKLDSLVNKFYDVVLDVIIKSAIALFGAGLLFKIIVFTVECFKQ